MARTIRPATPMTLARLDQVTHLLAQALTMAKEADSPALAKKIRSAIKSAGDAALKLAETKSQET